VELSDTDSLRGCIDTEDPRAEANGTQTKSLPKKGCCIDATGLTLEELPFEEFTMDFPETKDNWTDKDGLRKSLLGLAMESEERFKFNENTATYPTAQDIIDNIDYLHRPQSILCCCITLYIGYK